MLGRAKQRAEALKKKIICLVRRIWFLAWNIVTGPFRITWWCLEYVAELLLVVAKTTVQKAFILTLTVITIILVSTLMYAGFVHLYMPTAEISRPVHLNFRACSSGHGVCSFPSTNVSFFTDDGTQKEVLGAGQRYRVMLDIEMPDTPINRDLGMFQVLIEMYDRHGHITASSQRVAMPKYRSIVVRMLDVILYSPFYFFGFMEQKQDLNVELFSHYVEDYYHPSVGARIEVQSHSIQFYSVSLKLFANFTGLKYILYYWPVTSAIGGITYNVFLLIALLLGAMYKKAQSLRKISEALKLRGNKEKESKSLEEESGEEVTETSVKSTTINEDEKDSLDESTCSTKSAVTVSEMDDSEAYDLPVIQEPQDFLDDDEDKDLEFVADLRRRRIN